MKKQNPATATPESEVIRETIQAPYKFTDAEKLKLGDQLLDAMRTQDQIDREFDSVKQEFKARIEKAELERDVLRAKLSDGFEMRPTVAIVEFNQPRAGRKQFRNEETGELIRDEQMSALDFERPLFREEPESAVTAEE